MELFSSERRKQTALAWALTVSLGAAACGGGASQSSGPGVAPRPSSLHYESLQARPGAPKVQLSKEAGAVALAGDPSVTGQTAATWHRAVMLGAPRQQLEANRGPNDSRCVAFAGPQGGKPDVYVLGPDIKLDTDLNNPEEDRMIVIMGPNTTQFQFCLSGPGGVRLVQTHLVQSAEDLTKLAQQHPGAVAMFAQAPQ